MKLFARNVKFATWKDPFKTRLLGRSEFLYRHIHVYHVKIFSCQQNIMEDFSLVQFKFCGKFHIPFSASHQ